MIRFADNNLESCNVFPNQYLSLQLDKLADKYSTIVIYDRDKHFLTSSKIDALAKYCMRRNLRKKEGIVLFYINELW